MNKGIVKAFLWAMGVALYLRFGLEPTGWFFYEASHTLSIDWLYWGYSGFRGAGYAFGLWAYQGLACAAMGIFVGLIVFKRSSRGAS